MYVYHLCEFLIFIRMQNPECECECERECALCAMYYMVMRLLADGWWSGAGSCVMQDVPCELRAFISRSTCMLCVCNEFSL